MSLTDANALENSRAAALPDGAGAGTATATATGSGSGAGMGDVIIGDDESIWNLSSSWQALGSDAQQGVDIPLGLASPLSPQSPTSPMQSLTGQPEVAPEGSVGAAQQSAAGALSWRASWVGALDAVGLSAPSALASTAVVYALFPAAYLPSGLLMALAGLVLAHWASAGSHRPMMQTARLLEATILAAALTQLQPRLLGWGLPDTPAVLLALMCVLCALAGLFRALLFALRADRFARLIPAPVFAGYMLSVVLMLLISQSERLWSLARAGHPLVALVAIGIVAAGVTAAVGWRRPQWPAAALGLGCGALAGWVCSLLVPGVLTVMTAQANAWQLPFQWADFQALAAPQVVYAAVIPSLLLNGAVLGVSVFLNTCLASETISQQDDRYATPWQQGGLSLVCAGVGLLGAVPISASTQSSLAAMRSGPLVGRNVALAGLLLGLLMLTGLLNHMALAAVAAVMLVDALHMADRAALKTCWQWLRGKSIGVSERDDSLLILAVVGASIAFNGVVGIIVGLFAGLLLFGMRNARKPVRFEWTGLQLTANAHRDGVESALLAAHGQQICILEFESELFFGSVRSLDETLLSTSCEVSVMVLDWSRVRHVDSSVALSLSRWRRHALALAPGPVQRLITLHAGAGLQAGNAPEFLRQYAGQERCFPDLDHALEHAENLLIEQFLPKRDEADEADGDVLPIFQGLSDAQMRMLDVSMPQQLFRAGEAVLQIGQPVDEMYVIVQGSLAVVAYDAHGNEVRLALARRGGVLGEIGFFDQGEATAQVRAATDTLVLLLHRQLLVELQRDYPDILTQLLINLTRILSHKVLKTNKLALSRS